MIQAIERFLVLPRDLVKLILRLNIVTDVHEIGYLIDVHAYFAKLVVQVLDRFAELEYLYPRGLQKFQEELRLAESACNALLLEHGELAFGQAKR